MFISDEMKNLLRIIMNMDQGKRKQEKANITYYEAILGTMTN